MIGRLSAVIVIFVLWNLSGLCMWLMWSMAGFVGPVRVLLLFPALALFVAGFEILRKELR
jgi:hypothetical protein